MQGSQVPRRRWARRNGLSQAIKCEAPHALLQQKGHTLKPLSCKRPAVGNELRLHRSQQETRTGRRRRSCFSRSWKIVCLVGSTTFLDRVCLVGSTTLRDEGEGKRKEKGKAEGARYEESEQMLLKPLREWKVSWSLRFTNDNQSKSAMDRVSKLR